MKSTPRPQWRKAKYDSGYVSLPLHFGYYWVFYPDDTIHVAYFSGSKFEVVTSDGVSYVEHPTHWMEITVPEPPAKVECEICNR